MKAWRRIDPAAWRGLDLRAHGLLEGVPLHDAWRVELPGGGSERSLRDVRPLLAPGGPGSRGSAARGLFALRRALGRLLRWDEAPAGAAPPSALARLTAEDRARSWLEPGLREGPFTVLYAFAREAASEVRNPTVHAFSVLALEPAPAGWRLFWAIYVQPVGAITPLYMALIDPFRRAIVYPAILGHVHRAWRDRFATPRATAP